MTEDLITNNFTAGIHIRLIKKILLLIKVLFCIAVMYCVIELYLWYGVVIKTIDFDMSLPGNFYHYRIQPATMLLLFLLTVSGYMLNIKSFTFISRGIEESDTQLFNKGYAYFYNVIILSAISISVGIVNAVITLVLK
jgi:hypothetical protein